MALKITFRQMRLCLYTIISLLMIWLVMGHFILVKFNIVNNTQEIKIDCYFLAPMNTKRALENFNIQSEIPGQKVSYNYLWYNPFHLELTIKEKKHLQGIEYRYSFKKAKAMIPPFTVSKEGTVGTKVIPELLSISPAKNAPSTGPIALQFNTPILKESFQHKVYCEVGGKFSPVQNNYTRWLFTPNEQMKHQQSYRITIEPGLQGRHGLINNKKTVVEFTTAPSFKITETYPQNNADSVWLSRSIKITTNQPIKKYQLTGNIAGQTVIEDNVLSIYPGRILRPNTPYQLTLDLTSIYGERVTADINFHTTNIGNKKWLEIKAGTPCQVWLLEGAQQLKSVQGWFTKELVNLPQVTMYEVARGSSKGITTKEMFPWVRLNTDILLHSTDYTGKDDHQTLGLPHTYSCILLPSNIMEELVNSYPAEFMIIVH